MSEPIPLRRRAVLRPLVVGAVLLVAISAALLAAERLMGAPRSDVEHLGVFLFVSGAASLGLGAATMGWATSHLGSLRPRVVLALAIGLVIALVNVVTTSALMFLSPHDLALLFLLLAFSGVVSLTFGYAVASSLTGDLEALGLVARRLADGDLRARARVAGRDEVARLGAAFDHMAASLEASFERERTLEAARRDLIAAVSHDLRTPLATTRAMVEAISDGVVSEPDEVRRYLALIGSETRHLSRLIDDLFELSQIDAGALRLTRVPLSLRGLAATVVAAYAPAAADRGLQVEAISTAEATASADAGRVERVLRNLVDNALRHTPSGGRVIVETGAADTWAEVRVSDSGPGIPAEEQERVFERFYRGERSRARGESAEGSAPGAGLGLAIARALTAAHGGCLSVESPGPLGGATFVMRLPLCVEPN